jgi:hypothetical protein
MTYRFIGTEAEIGGEKLTRFGQTISLPDGRAKDAILGAGPEQGWAGATAIIQDSEWTKLGVTDEEQRLYAYPAGRERMTSEFRAKYKAAMTALEATRESLLAPAEPETPVTTEVPTEKGA